MAVSAMGSAGPWLSRRARRKPGSSRRGAGGQCVRIRRPHQHESLLIELRDEAAFSTFRDALLFAAAVGARFERRVPFTSAAGDPIRYETLTAPTFAEALVSMIAANEVDNDPEIMDSTRLDERAKISRSTPTADWSTSRSRSTCVTSLPPSW